MNFPKFLLSLKDLRRRGWQVVLKEVNCRNTDEKHKHLVFRLRHSALRNRIFTPIEAIEISSGKKFAEIYRDPRISVGAIERASEYVDWMRDGEPRGVEARLEMLPALGLTEADILKIAPEPRG